MTTIDYQKHSWDADKDGWDWTLADPMEDSKEITDLANTHFRSGMEDILTIDYSWMLENVTKDAVQQVFDKSELYLSVCRRHSDGELLAYCWLDRGCLMHYSRDEMSNQKFIHIRQDLSTRDRVKLTYQCIHQHLLWASTHGIPVVCSTSVLEDSTTFMRIHKELGYTVRGSYAYRRTTS